MSCNLLWRQISGVVDVLAIGLAMTVISDELFIWSQANGTYFNGGPADFLSMMGGFLLMFGFYMHRKTL